MAHGHYAPMPLSYSYVKVDKMKQRPNRQFLYPIRHFIAKKYKYLIK